jgi:prepilin-type N-terminal cleavage/methylation domain-containing protein
MKTRPRFGFTLVELLVVIAIIGMLVALLLPAINSAREAGRRSTCMNNLHQISLALNTHISTYGRLPAGATITPTFASAYLSRDFSVWYEATQTYPGSSGASWMVYILPYMERHDLYDHWDFTHSVLVNKAQAQTDIKEFYCPSRRAGVRPGDVSIMFQGWTSGGTDYGACMGHGDIWVNTLGPSGDHFFVDSQYVVPNAAPSSTPAYAQTRLEAGVFYPNSRTTLNQVTDGPSHTIMVAELQRLHDPGYVPAGQNPEYYGPSLQSNDGWAVGGVSCAFDCNIANGDGDLGQTGGLNNNFFEGAGSLHPGGANFGSVDGAVHFINENIDQNTYALLGSMADGGRFATSPTAAPLFVDFPDH